MSLASEKRAEARRRRTGPPGSGDQHQRQSAPEPTTSVAKAASATAALRTRWFQRNTVHLLWGDSRKDVLLCEYREQDPTGSPPFGGCQASLVAVLVRSEHGRRRTDRHDAGRSPNHRGNRIGRDACLGGRLRSGTSGLGRERRPRDARGRRGARDQLGRDGKALLQPRDRARHHRAGDGRDDRRDHPRLRGGRDHDVPLPVDARLPSGRVRGLAPGARARAVRCAGPRLPGRQARRAAPARSSG
jgi:hypothetical protein